MNLLIQFASCWLGFSAGLYVFGELLTIKADLLDADGSRRIIIIGVSTAVFA